MKKLGMNKASLLVALMSFGIWIACATGPLAGQTVKETRNPGPFNALSLSMSANVYLSQGNNLSVEIECDKNDLEYIETETKGNTLEIKTRNGHWHDLGNVKIYITMKDINGLNISGSGNIQSQTPIHSSDLKINVSGSGNVKIAALESMEISSIITGSGDISISGRNDQAKMDATITGSGSFKADELPVANASVTITGSGSARVNVLKELETNITGSGSVQYKGNPLVNANSTGSGRTTSLKN